METVGVVLTRRVGTRLEASVSRIQDLGTIYAAALLRQVLPGGRTFRLLEAGIEQHDSQSGADRQTQQGPSPSAT